MLLQENICSLSQAARDLATKPSPCTMWRWSTKGIHGVRLETALIGGRRVTSKEALQRFIERTTAARAKPADAPAERSPETIAKLRAAGLI